MGYNSDFNIQAHQIEPYVLIDELSDTELYVGTSISYNNKGMSIWRIKRTIKIGSVWQTEYPNGNQDFKFTWDDRLLYEYK